MIHVQLRRYLPDAVTPGEVMDVEEIQFSTVGSATAALTLKVSLAVSEGIRSWIESHPGQAFVVGVEFAVDGGEWIAPRNNLYVAYRGSADDIDPAEVQQIICMDWVTWQLTRTYVHWTAAAKDNTRTWTASSAGAILSGLIAESKGRGWGPALTAPFSSAVDSAGAPWVASDKIDQPYQLLTPLSQVLSSLTEQGMCDWWTEGTALRLFRPGVGVDRTDVVLGGAGFSRAPGSWDFSNVFTNLTVVPEKASHWLYLTNAGADTSFGRLEATMTQSDIADHPTATRLAQPILSAGRAAKREQSYEWTVTDGMPAPWRDFNVFDLVTIDTAFGVREERVVELVVRVRDDVVTCVAVTGDRMLSAVAKRDRRAQAAVIGNIIGGSGNGLPGASGPSTAEPEAPTGLHVISNEGSWNPDGSAQATVVLGWEAVSQTVDGSSVDVAGYEVAARTAASDPVLSTTTGVTFTSYDWAPDAPRYVRVRAVSRSGRASAWSAEIAVTPGAPPTLVPKAPTGLAEVSNSGVFRPDGSALSTVSVAWTPVTTSLDDAPVVVAEYEVMIGDAAQRATTPEATFTISAGELVDVSVRARTDLGIWGDPSTPITVTGEAPANAMLIPSTPSLTTGLSTVSVAWDGLIGTAPPPGGFGYIVIEVSRDDGPWARLGTSMTGPGGSVVRATLGETVQTRLRAFDTLGRPGGVSEVASIVVTGIVGPDIEADTITGNHVVAGTLEVNHVSPSFGADLDISASESVTIIVGKQNEQAGQLADVTAGVQDAQSAADAASSAAGSAQATANGAASTAAGAVAAASDVAQRLDRHQTFYRFGVDGLAIGDPNVNSELRLKPDRIEMTQNNVVVSYWEGGVFVADEARLDSAQIGNHQFMAYGTGRTIVRPL